jgi:predicted transposase/invertase (TIGR01784 family)
LKKDIVYIIFAILCDFKDKNPKIIIEQILKKIYKIIKTENELNKYLLILEEISTLRNLKETFKEVEMRYSDIRFEDLPSYEIGLEAGIQRGMQQGIQRGMQQGMQQAKKETIINGYRAGIDLEMISKMLKMKVDEIKEVLIQNNIIRG